MHGACDAVVAWHGGRAVTAGQFVSAAQALAARLPAAAHALNLCGDRYHFAVAFAASMLRGQCTLLPGAYAPELIRRLQSRTPDMICLTDGSAAREQLPRLRCPVLRIDTPLPGELPSQLPASSIPPIDAAQLVARVFTSGSTGVPMGHDKSWGQLVHSVRVGAQRLLQGGRGWSILGTVPAQHMYGFEVTVLLPLQSGGTLSSARPFFPADIAAALAALPRPRALVSTPVHLRALVDSDIDLPALDLFVSATAALAADLAQELERRYAAPLLEIYGSTETGQMASRRTVAEPAWRLWPGVALQIDARGGCQATGGHLREPTPLADILVPIGTDRFLLEGRTADLVNIAGKRSSLAYLTQQLTAIPGVLDGVFFVRADAPASVAGVTRLAAVAVAPELDVARITAALRERIDPVFLPRPLLLVERLPRNDTGKLPQQRLLELTAEATTAAPELLT